MEVYKTEKYTAEQCTELTRVRLQDGRALGAEAGEWVVRGSDGSVKGVYTDEDFKVSYAAADGSEWGQEDSAGAEQGGE